MPFYSPCHGITTDTRQCYWSKKVLPCVGKALCYYKAAMLHSLWQINELTCQNNPASGKITCQTSALSPFLLSLSSLLFHFSLSFCSVLISFISLTVFLFSFFLLSFIFFHLSFCFLYSFSFPCSFHELHFSFISLCPQGLPGVCFLW